MHLKDDPTRWWEKEHDPRCNITVIGAEPLVVGGGCTCHARLSEKSPPEFVVTASDGVSYVDGFFVEEGSDG